MNDISTGNNHFKNIWSNIYEVYINETKMDESYNRVITNLKTTLYEPYQSDGVKWMLQREFDENILCDEIVSRGGVLADEVGLGKTLMSISVIIGNPLDRTLILLPKSLVHQWKTQIQKFTHLQEIYIVDKQTKIDSNSTGVYLMSNSLLNCKNAIVGSSLIHQLEWDRVIIDEAHLLRNSKSKIYNSCMCIDADIRWCLTATPVMNRMTDFVNLMGFLNVSQFLCQSDKEKVVNTFILRRTKEDVSKYNSSLELPECKIDVEYIPFETKDEIDIYLSVFAKERQKVMTNKNKTVTDLLEHLLRIRQLSIHPQLYLDGMTKKTKHDHGTWDKPVTKINKLIEKITNQPKNEKTLIFCQFIKEMDIYQKALEEHGYKIVRLDGSMTMEDRNISVEKFKKIPNISIFLIQIATGGQGINLQNASRIYIMSPSWNPAIEYQAIGRSHRTGQKRKVYVTKFVIYSGDDRIPFVEESMIKLQESKKQIISDVLNDTRIVNDGTNFISKYDSEIDCKDIMHLFNIKRLI